MDNINQEPILKSSKVAKVTSYTQMGLCVSLGIPLTWLIGSWYEWPLPLPLELDNMVDYGATKT